MIELRGLPANAGYAQGKGFLVSCRTGLESDDRRIVIAKELTPDLILDLQNAVGIITETGGMTCHAATIARELNIPCVTGVSGLMAIVHSGMEITIFNDGTIRIGDE